MFTGLIEDLGRLTAVEHRGKTGKLSVKTALPLNEIALGDSIAVNGVCLTVEGFSSNMVHFHCLSETLSVTNLGGCKTGSVLNLERAMQLGGRMGGHIVSGHVDFCGTVASAGMKGDDFQLVINFPKEQRDFLVHKGSVAINGVSLTIADLTDTQIVICLIPMTQAKTNLEVLSKGDLVNVETDIIGKYVASIISRANPHKNVTMDSLMQAGFL